MKKLLLLLLAVLSLAACQKEKDVTPKALADRFTGTYTLTSFRYLENNDGVNLPELPATNAGKTVSGTVTLTKKSDVRLDLKLVLKATGMDDSVSGLNDLEVRQVGSAYGLFTNGTRVADVEGSIIIFNFSHNDPQTGDRTELVFNARR